MAHSRTWSENIQNEPGASGSVRKQGSAKEKNDGGRTKGHRKLSGQVKELSVAKVGTF